MATENFTTYTEVDPTSLIAVTASRVTWTALNRGVDAYVYADKGVGYFGGDFEIDFTHLVSGGTNSGTAICFACTLANVVDDYNGIKSASGSVFAVVLERGILPDTPRMYLIELDSGNEYGSATDFSPTQGVAYYFTLVRDESVGTYGTLYLYVYSDVARTNLLATLSIALHSSRKNFRYLYGIQSFNTGEAAINHSGYIEDLDIISAPGFTPKIFYF